MNFKYKIKFEDASPLTTVPFQDIQVQGLDFTKRDLGDRLAVNQSACSTAGSELRSEVGSRDRNCDSADRPSHGTPAGAAV